MNSIDAVLEEIARASEAALPPGFASPEVKPKRSGLSGMAGQFPAVFSDSRARHDARPPAADWGALAAVDDTSFIRDIYEVVLGRPPEPTALQNLRDGLATGRLDRLGIAAALLVSDEAKGRAVAIRGFGLARLIAKLHRLPIIGRFMRIATATFHLPWHLSVLERRLAIIEDRQSRMVADADEMAAFVGHVHAALMPTLSLIDNELVELRDGSEMLLREDQERRLSLERLIGRIDDAHSRVKEVQAFADSKLEEAKATHRKTLAEASALRHLLGSALPLKASNDPGVISEAIQKVDEHALDDLYLAFENKFRGTPAMIAARCERYLPVMAGTPAVESGGLVLDIGSGRGEWLGLLTKQGHQCRGVDLNVAMVAAAQGDGHDVVSGDAIAYLREQPANSLGAITGFHIVEHLPFRVLIELLDQAHRVLMPGGAILFETPNPECLVVGACNFYYDPTHQNPLPPELMRFLALARTFSSARIIRTDADCDLHNPESGFSPKDVNSWFQVPMDYALYARKA